MAVSSFKPLPSLLDRHEALEPYLAIMRLDRPVGTLLLLWPTLAALWFAAGGLPPIGLIVVFTLGTFLMRSAGCIVNDIADRRFDKYVTRTAARPLVTGRLSMAQAVLLLLTLTLLAAALLWFVNPLTRWLALGGLGIAAIYPLMKRWTYLPQTVLGAAFSWGLVMAYSATRGELPAEAWLLFIASMMWIVAYDTMYAMVDREDDLKVGVRSTAILFGANDRFMIGLLQMTALVTLWLFAERIDARGGVQAGIGAAAVLFIYQQYLIRDRDRDGCFRAFGNNVWVGFALFVGALIEFHVLPRLGSVI